jgi:aldose 1-epimerase
MKSKPKATASSCTKFLGILPNGKEIVAYEVSNTKGMSLKVMNYGATVIALKKTLKNGELVDLVLGFDTLNDYIESYLLPSAPYLGATVGRFAGRIANATFDLDGKKIVLNQNNNGNALHGGLEGFSQKVWQLEQLKTSNNPSITLEYVSPDGEEHFPGELKVSVTYTLTEENELEIEYKAISDSATVVNLTNHSYFNLEGQKGNVFDQELHINAAEILATNEMIPTGEMIPVVNTDFDFTIPKSCPTSIDTTYVLDANFTLAATLFSPKNNLKMSVFTNQPGLHVYVGGNCFKEIKDKEDVFIHQQTGICFEAQNFPDAPNHAHFPSALLLQGDNYFHKTIYKFQSF